MSAPTIPAGRKVCRGCAVELAKPGRRHCVRCLGEFSVPVLPNPYEFVSLAETLPASVHATLRISEVPRIEKLPVPRSREAEALARRITAWVGLLVLWAFASGWAFGRFA
jgi:hypothetical protein